ncbi:MAG: hypothetical protein CL916_01450, partial [Deltaproteobacteria bacterium]|nr:hypothetical protein [Deltaproteobacteria bacterium]
MRRTNIISLFIFSALYACTETEKNNARGSGAPENNEQVSKEERESLLPDSYVLTASSADLVSTINEDVAGNNSGTLQDVETMFASTITIDTNTEALYGVLVYDNTSESFEGTWEYSADGSVWTPIAASSDVDSAIFIDKTDFLRFAPSTDYNRSVAEHGIDFQVLFNDDIASSAHCIALTPTTGTAYDIDTAGQEFDGSCLVSEQVLTSIVTAVNDAPVFNLGSGNPTLAASTEDDFTPAGDTVSDLFSPVFDDDKDIVLDGSSVAVPNATSGDSLSGVVIVSNGADSVTEGVWEYRLSSLGTWSAIATDVTVSATNGLLLDTSAELRFVPVGDFTGAPTGLEAHLVEDSLAETFTTDKASPVTYDFSNIAHTHVSASAATLGTSVSSVEDDPTFTAITDLTITEDKAGSDTTGDARTISTIFSSFFSDSDSGQTLQGIAIGSVAEFSGVGHWEYSLDGTTWVDVEPVTSYSSTTALALDATDFLRFVPDQHFNKTTAVGGLSVYPIDSSSSVTYTTTTLTPSTIVIDTSTATDGIGQTPATVSVIVGEANDDPQFTGPAALAAASEDTDPAGASVTSLVNGLFDDGTDAVTGGSS